MKLKVLYASATVYALAIMVAAMTSPGNRTYWPLYLPIVAVAALMLAARRR
ncbi:MAG: hypothetical protein M3Q89_14830 [Verrucomicrobiota bacterium]|nr:hypothetical protein [Verrucomicrobiota bacterium]